MLVRPPPPLREPLPSLTPPNLSYLSKKSAVGCLSYTISEDCTDGHLVRRKRLCAFEGPGHSKRLGDGRQRLRMNPNEGYDGYDGKRSPVDLLENSSHDLLQERSKLVREWKSQRLVMGDADWLKITSGEDEAEAEDSPRLNARTRSFIGRTEEKIIFRPMSPAKDTVPDLGAPVIIDEKLMGDCPVFVSNGKPDHNEDSKASGRNSKPLELPFAGQYSRPAELKRYNKTHLQYPECDKVFTGSDNFLRYMRVHKQIHGFSCTAEACNKKFAYGRDLQRHLQAIHMKERNNKCDYCGRLFARQDHMRRHQQKHCTKRFDIASPETRPDLGSPRFAENAYPRGIKATSRLEALANRRHAWRPTASVLNLGSQQMPHRAQKRQDAPRHVMVGDIAISDAWNDMGVDTIINSNVGPSKV